MLNQCARITKDKHYLSSAAHRFLHPGRCRRIERTWSPLFSRPSLPVIPTGASALLLKRSGGTSLHPLQFASHRPRPCSRSLQTAVLLRVFSPSPPRTLICAFCLPVASAGSHSEKYALPLLSLHARAHCLSRVILATSFSKYPELSRSPPPCLNRSSGTSSTFSANRPPAPLRYLEGFQESYQVVLLLL